MKISRRNFIGASAGACAYAALSPFIAKAQPLYFGPHNYGLRWPRTRTFPAFAAPVHLDAADIIPLNLDQQMLLTTLQGIVNRRRPRLYFFLNGDNTDQTWLETIAVPNTVIADPLSLVDKYGSEAKGAVIYDPNVPDTVNVATSLAGIMGGVIATADLASQYKLPVLEDLRGRFSTKLDAYNWVIDNYWPQLTHRLLTAIGPATPNLRDYIVATKALVFWLDLTSTDETSLFARILRKVPPNTPYIGSWFDSQEAQTVTFCSQYGVPVSSADYLDNATVLGGVRAPVRRVQPRASVPPLENKIYVTLTMSDGDNMQYCEHRLRTIWDDPSRGKVPLNWSVSPFLIETAPAMFNYYQRTQTPNDCLIAGPSGAGYTYPGQWPSADFPIYAKRTGEYMERAGMNVIYTLNLFNSYLDQLDFTDAVAGDYVQYVRPLGILGNWWINPSVLTTPAGLPVITQEIVYSVATGQGALASAAGSWDGNSPLFVAINVLSWNLTPADVNAIVASVGPQFEFVRADVFFKLIRKTMA